MARPQYVYDRIDKSKISKLRLSQNLTLAELASELCVCTDTIHKLETQKYKNSSSELIARLCEYFKIPFVDILQQPYREQMGKDMADFLLSHEVIDFGTAEGIKNFYSKPI